MTSVTVNMKGVRISVRTGSVMARGLVAASVRNGWLRGKNRPRSRRAAERAIWAAARRAA